MYGAFLEIGGRTTGACAAGMILEIDRNLVHMECAASQAARWGYAPWQGE